MCCVVLTVYCSSGITPFSAESINTGTIACSFEGSDDPTIKWYQGSGPTEISTSDANDAYTIADTAFSSEAKESVLTIDLTKITDMTPIKCGMTFSSYTDPIETSTNLHYRGMLIVISRDLTPP